MNAEPPDPLGPAGASRWNAGRTPDLGSRVVVRRRLAPGERTHLLTDVIGHLVEAEPELVVRRESGEEVRVPHAEVEVLKVLPPRAVRARDVRALEYVCALGWPGTEHEVVDGWLCRAGDDWSYRRDSAVPVLPWASAEELDGVRAWYAERGLPTRIAAVDRLVRTDRPGLSPTVAEWGRELLLSTGDAEQIAALEPERAQVVRLDAEPDDRWLGLYHGTAGLDPSRVLPALTATAGLVDDRPTTAGGEVAFARLEVDGELAAISRGAVTTGPDGVTRVGVGCVETDPARRRQGLAEVLTSALAAWGLERGAREVYLHVFADNAAGRGLWAKVGLTPHHSARYALLA